MVYVKNKQKKTLKKDGNKAKIQGITMVHVLKNNTYCLYVNKKLNMPLPLYTCS